MECCMNQRTRGDEDIVRTKVRGWLRCRNHCKRGKSFRNHCNRGDRCCRNHCNRGEEVLYKSL